MVWVREIFLVCISIVFCIVVPNVAEAGTLSDWKQDSFLPNDFYISSLKMSDQDILYVSGGYSNPDSESPAICGIFRSTNFGNDWTNLGITPDCFSYLTSSADGLNLVAANWGGEIYTSSDSGLTWNNRGNPKQWWGFSSSANGQTIIGITEKETFWVSNDFGITWDAHFTSSPGGSFTKSSISDDGTKLLVADSFGFLYLSLDRGETWVSKGDVGNWYAVAMNNDGSRMFAAKSNDGGAIGGIFVSTDFGHTWHQTGVDNTWWKIESNFSGKNLIATPTDKIDHVFVSNDYGQSWQSSNGRFLTGDIAISRNGQYVFASLSRDMSYAFKLYSSKYECGIGGIDLCAQAAALKAEVEAIAAKREAEKRSARSEISKKLKNSEKVTIEIFNQAEIAGITEENIEAVQAEIAALPEELRTDITQILKVAYKYEVVGIMASERVKAIYSNSLIEIGLISTESEHKATLTRVVKELSQDERSSYAGIKEAIEAEIVEIQKKKDRLANILALIASRRNG